MSNPSQTQLLLFPIVGLLALTFLGLLACGPISSNPTPLPTRCVEIVTSDWEAYTECHVYIQPTPFPEKYENLWYGLRGEVAKRDEQADAGQKAPGREMVLVRVKMEEGQRGDAVLDWLEDRGFEYQHFEAWKEGESPGEPSTVTGGMTTLVPYKRLVELSQLDGVWFVAPDDYDSGYIDPPPAPTPFPTSPPDCQHTFQPNDKLRTSLAVIVHQYETCQLTEHIAAAQANFYYRNTVLVLIEFSDVSARNLALIDSWVLHGFITDYDDVGAYLSRIYAYAPVSALGELSQPPEVESISQPYPPLPFNPEWGDDFGK